MDYKDLQKKKLGDLDKLLKEKRKSLREFRFGVSGSKTRNVKEGKLLKKEVAQILTSINQRRTE